jgi:hypothetical protein
VGEARMRVGNETRAYQEGKCFVFDDTFEHAVWNDSSVNTRVVMLFDFLHPSFTEEERTLMTQYLDEYRNTFRNHSMKEHEKNKKQSLLAKDWWR